MKKTRLAAAFLAAALALAAPSAFAAGAPPRHAAQGEPYLFGQLGLFDPGDDGYYVGGGIGSRVTDMVALDLGLSGYKTEDHGVDVRVWPLLAGVRLVLPNPVAEPYFGMGVGFYFVDPERVGSDVAFGGHASLGVDAWLSPKAALNGEFRYHFANAEVDGVDFDVDGPSFSLGVKVAF